MAESSAILMGQVMEILGPSSYGFCLKNKNGDLLYAQVKGTGITTNIEVETVAILEALRYCWRHRMMIVLLETDSLRLVNII